MQDVNPEVLLFLRHLALALLVHHRMGSIAILHLISCHEFFLIRLFSLCPIVLSLANTEPL